MTATTIRVQMAQRKDTAAGWTAANPILLLGEIGYETDAKKFKIGDGTTNWNSLAYLPIPDGSGNLTITGNLEIGSTGTLTFEGSTADGFETTLAVTDPTADRTITLPDVTGTVITSGDTGSVTSTMLADGTIVNADINAAAEIAVSKLANGTANQVLVTDGTDVSWSDNLTLAGDLTVNGTTTTINTQDLLVEDKNIIIGNVDTPTDVTADGGGITLKGSTDKTINWVDATDAWTLSENVNIASGKEYRIDGTKVLDATSLGSAVVSSSLTSVGTIGTGVWNGTTVATGYGGTGQTTYTDGELLIGKTDGTLAKATITQGSGVTITNGDGTITIAATGSGGTVTSVDVTGGTGLTSSGGPITSSGAITVDLDDTAVTPGSYTYASITVDQQGRLTAASNGTAPLISSDIGVTVQGYDADTAKLDATQTFTAAQTFAADLTLNAQSDLRFADSDSSNWVAFQAPATIASNVTWTLPSADGTANQVLQTDGSGTLSWATFSTSTDIISEGNTSAEVIDTGSDGRFVVTTDGTERLRIDSQGRVGIGTASPSRLLHLYGTSGGTQIRAENTSGFAELELIGGGSVNYISSDDRLDFYVNGSARTTIDTSGRLLVGTSSSASDSVLQIQGTAGDTTAQGAVSLRRGYTPISDLGSGSTIGKVDFEVSNGGVGARIAAEGDAAMNTNDYPSRLVFSTCASGASSPTERMRISSAGDLYAANTDGLTASTSVGLYYAAGSYFSVCTNGESTAYWNRLTSDGSIHTMRRSGTTVGTISVTTTATAYNTSSDYRLKENIVPLTGAADRLNQLQVRRFNFIADPGKTVDGFIAHEAQAVVPECATGTKDEVDDEGKPVYQGIDQSKLVPLLTAALQEALAEIESLKARVTALEP